MLSKKGMSAALEAALPRMSRAMEASMAKIGGRILFHQLVQAAMVLGMAVAKIYVEEICRVLNLHVRKTSPHCPECKRRMERTRDVEIQPNTAVGVVSIRRGHYQCARCRGVTRYPFDEQLGLAGQVCESLVRSLALLGASVPYRMAVWTLQQLQGVYVSAKTCQARTMEIAHDLVERLDRKVKKFHESVEERDRVRARAPQVYRLYISLDGTMTNIRADGWKEIRIGAFWAESEEAARAKIQNHKRRLKGQRPAPRKRKKKRRKKPSGGRSDIRYMVRFRSVEEFSRALYAMAVELGVDAAQEVVVIADGAPWIWNLADESFPNATKIIDWYHAIQRVWKAANAIYQQDQENAKPWVRSRKKNLLAGRPELVVRALQQARRSKKLSVDAAETVRLAIGYFTEYSDKMDYAAYLNRGCDIGSGRIEAACKRIVGARLKVTGSRWCRENAEAMAVLRAEMLSGRLEALWQERDRDMLAQAVRKSPRQARSRAA